jgi:hypothetical protein
LADFTLSGRFQERVAPVLNRGEAVNAPKRIYTGRIARRMAKRVDEMQAVADALSLMANIVMAWNTSQMQAVLDRWSNRRRHSTELIGKIAPTGLGEHQLAGVFRFPRLTAMLTKSRLRGQMHRYRTNG